MLSFKPFFKGQPRFGTCREFDHIDVFGHRTCFQIYVRSRNIDGKHDFSTLPTLETITNCRNCIIDVFKNYSYQDWD